jgi:hypothetical protein
MRPESASLVAATRASWYASAFLARDDRERGDRLERAEVLVGAPAHLGEAHRQRALELAVPHHRDAGGGLDRAEGIVRDLHLALVGVGDERLGRQHAPGDALAATEDDPGPARVAVVARGGDAAPRAVGEVDAGQRAAHGVLAKSIASSSKSRGSWLMRIAT